MNSSSLFVLFCAAFLVLAGCTSSPSSKEKKHAGLGDIVLVGYTLGLENGSPVDASNVSFLVGKGSLIQAIDEGVVGLAEGESRNFTAPPERAFGAWNPALVKQLQRRYNISRFNDVSFTYFAANYGNDSSIGKQVALKNWNATIVANASSVRLRHDPAVGTVVPKDPFPQRVVEVGEDFFTVEYEAHAGLTGKLFNSTTGTVTHLRVLNVTDDFVTVDTNHELAGKTLSISLTLYNITRSAS